MTIENYFERRIRPIVEDNNKSQVKVEVVMDIITDIIAIVVDIVAIVLVPPLTLHTLIPQTHTLMP